MKRYVLVRGESGLLYLYGRDLWMYMSDKGALKSYGGLEFVADNDDPEVLRQMQALVNKDLKSEVTNVSKDK